ncbi:hypothetical protein D3C85_1161740 [compost metagenome]
MRHHRRDAPAARPEQSTNDGFQNQADKTQQLQGVLPDPVHRTANARQQLNADADFRFLDRHTEIGQRLVDGLQQCAVGGRKGAIGMFGGPAQALGAQQLHQQRGAGGIKGPEAVEIDARVVVVLAFELFAQKLEVGVMGERPVPRHPYLSGGVRGVQLGIAGHCIAGHKLRAFSAIYADLRNSTNCLTFL